jgi:hypothetical protein
MTNKDIIEIIRRRAERAIYFEDQMYKEKG